MAKFLCPYCYEMHTKEQCLVTCLYHNTHDAKKVCANDFKKDPSGFVEEKSKTKCFKCTHTVTRLHCPESKNEIPEDLMIFGGLPIALVGAKASGKSNYIAVLVNEIKKKMTRHFNCSINMSCADSQKNYNDFYYNPLFKSKKVVGATDAVEIPPLIFPLQFMNDKNKITNVATLTFYDTAGENLDSIEDMTVNNKYIPNAKGIILLLDPLQIESIREKLKEKGMTQLPPIYTDVNEVLSRIVETIRRVKKINAKKKIDIPLAVTFTKIDALEKYGILPEGGCLVDESEHIDRGLFVDSEFSNTSIEMQDLVDNWLSGELESLMKNFEKYAFFGLTALGNIPNRNDISEIKPKRVLDPLLWILAENKFIKRVKN